MEEIKQWDVMEDIINYPRAGDQNHNEAGQSLKTWVISEWQKRKKTQPTIPPHLKV